ncbi:MAG: crotonase/enoyl-CoA hydratase family protein [Rhizobiaceae bacterium]|nr:crotonase/enoyl-CoA hydratase family protein [Rhizobiaceae bacterium]
MTDHILIERPEAASQLLIIRLNRPEKKNALTRAMYQAMTSALQMADETPDIRVVVFLGSEGCFSAGNDMADFLAFATSGEMGREVLDFLKALVRLTKPVVSGVDGLAIGIGATIHLHCDLTVASDRSLFKTPFVDLALVPEAASSLIAPRLMGHQRAFALLALGDAFSAEEARDAGLIRKVTTSDAVEAETLALAAKLAAKPPEALRLARKLIKGSPDEIIACIDDEAKLFASQLKTAEARAAFEAFMKR